MAGFDLFPVVGDVDATTGTKWTNCLLWQQLDDALEEKGKPFNCASEFPPPSALWFTATPASIDDATADEPPTLTFHFDGVDWHVPSGFSGTRWVDYASSDPDLCYIVSNYDLVLIGDFADPRTWIRSTITASTYDAGSSTGTVTVSAVPFLNAIAAKFIPDLAYLDGKETRFYKAVTGLTSRDRRLPRPNHLERWRGSVEAGWVDDDGNGYVLQTSSIYNSDPYNKDTNDVVAWGGDEYAGDDVLAFDGASPPRLHRATVAGNDSTHLFFGATTIADLTPTATAVDLAGTFVVVPGGDEATPAIDLNPPHAWYRGAMRGYLSHGPKDDRVTANKPTPIVGWQDLNSDDECEEFPHFCFDVDCQIELTNACECARAGDWVAPLFYATPRGRQLAALGLLPSYVDIFNTFGDGSLVGLVRLFTPATWAVGFLGANPSSGLAAWSSTAGFVDGSTLDVGAPPFTFPGATHAVYYTIESEHEEIIAAGVGSIDAAGTLTGGPFDSGWDGYTVSLWLGFKRIYRRRVRYLYPKSQWTPDVDADDGLLDPPAVTPGGELADPTTGLVALAHAAGGALTYNTTYAYRFSYVNGSGETLASTEISIKAAYCPKTCDTPPCPPSALVSHCVTTNTYAVELTWPKVAGASTVRIYGRTSGSELKLADVSIDAASWTDDGSITPTGALPSSNTTHNDCFGVGLWVHRDASRDGYVGRSPFGFVGEGDPAFVDDELAIYAGDTVFDPFDGRGGVSTDTRPDDAYWDRFYRGTYRKATQLLRVGKQAGTIVAGTTYSFTTDQDWWNGDGVNDGTLRVQGGTTSGGSSTTAVFTGLSGERLCWWAPSRYVGSLDGVSATPYSFFVVELYKAGLDPDWSVAADGTATWGGAGDEPAPDYKVAIASFTSSGTTGTIHFANAIAEAVGADWGFLIREPKYELNRQRGRTVTVTRDDGSTFKLVVRYSDGDTAFVDVQADAFAAGWSFTIDELDTSSVVRHASSAPTDPATRFVEYAAGKYWVQPTGSDTRSGADVPFLPDMKANLATRVDDYGLAMAGDDVAPQLFNELYYMISSMRWITKDVTFRSRHDLAVAEKNFVGMVMPGDGSPFDGGGFYPGDPSTWDGTSYPQPEATWNDAVGAAKANATTSLTDPANPTLAENAGTPHQFMDFFDDESYDDGSVTQSGEVTFGGNSEYEYGVAEVVDCLDCEVDFYNWGSIDSGDPPPNPGVHGTTLIDGSWTCDDPNFYITQFDAMGNSIAYHAWTKWDTQPGGGSTTEVVSIKLGSLAPPTWPAVTEATQAMSCAYPPATVGSWNAFEISGIGWYALRKKAIARYDVAGGFEFV